MIFSNIFIDYIDRRGEIIKMTKFTQNTNFEQDNKIQTQIWKRYVLFVYIYSIFYIYQSLFYLINFIYFILYILEDERKGPKF